MTETTFAVEREILIRARRATVFRYFTDSVRFASWWGTGSRIEGRPGGSVVICYPGGVVARGEVVRIEPPSLVEFTFGFDDPARPIPPGGSRVVVRLEDDPAGTRLRLRHEVADATVREQFVPGWRYQLALFASVAAAEEHAGVAERIDAMLAAWHETDAARRQDRLASVVTGAVTFRDPFGCTSGLDELSAHIGAVQVHMPGATLVRDGDVLQCQGTAVARWTAHGPDGTPRGRGLNVYDLAPDGRIAGIVGLWER